MKGNYMSLDCKWLVCSPCGGVGGGVNVEWCEDHPSIRRSSISHWMSSSSNRSSKSEEGKQKRRNEFRSTTWFPQMFQAFPHKAALQLGGFEGGAVIKGKARADESAECFCRTADCLWGQRSAGKCMNMHGNNVVHPQVADATTIKRSFTLEPFWRLCIFLSHAGLNNSFSCIYFSSRSTHIVVNS